MALPRSVSVTFAAIMGPFVGPIRAAGGSVLGLSRTIEGATGRQAQALNRLGRTGTVMGLGLAAGFVVAVKAAADFDKSMSVVAAVSNATGKELDGLRKTALQAGKDTKYSAKQAADAEGELAKAGISTADIMGGALTGSLSLAAAGQLDLSEAATVSAQAMHIFNLQGKDVGHIADVLAAGANKSAADVHQLAWSLKMGGQVAAQTGLSLESTVGVLSAFADNALIGSDAGTSLKTMLQHLANPSEKSAGLMRDLGLEVYDTSGNFVGMAQFAANLQKALGNLSQEQRDQALATIFGSDAVRGANVLYKIGAAGVEEYTNAVNDNGAAARVAGKQMDNLAGDLELLKGSIETALIQSGSGANSALRELTQGVNGVVNAFLGLPNGIQSSIVVVAGITGGVILLTKGLLFLVQTARDARIAMVALGLTGARLSAAMAAVRTALASTASFLAGPWGIAIGAAVAILGVWYFSKKKAAQATQEFTAAIEADSGAFGENTRAAVANELEKRGMLRTSQDLGISLSTVTEAILGNEEALRIVNQALDDNLLRLQQHLAEVPADEDAVNKQSTAIHKFREELNNQTGSLKESSEAAKRKADATKDATVATGQSTSSLQTATTATTLHNEAEQKLIDTMKSATSTAKDLKDAFDGLAGGNIELARAQIKVNTATDQALKQADKKKGITDAELSSLIDLATADQDVLVGMKATGATSDELIKKQAQLSSKFVEVAVHMGDTRAHATELARSFGLFTIKANETTGSLDDWIIKANEAAGSAQRLALRTGGNAKDANESFRASINRMLPVLYALTNGDRALTAKVDDLARASGNVAGKMDVSRSAFIRAANAMGIGVSEARKLWSALQQIKSKSVTVTVSGKGNFTNPGTIPEFHGRARGGPIPMVPGASRDYDSVPALLRVDEHVLTPEEVDAAGGHEAVYRLRRALLSGRVQGFAKGGAAGRAELTKPGGAAIVMEPIRTGYNNILISLAKAIAKALAAAMSGGSIVAAARSMIGLPYSWGGGGPSGPSYGIGRGAGTYGFDCSGLTEYAWWKGRHIDIGGTTGPQAAGSHAISGPRPGALGFIGSPIHHVMLGSDKPGYVIQAPYTGSFVQEVQRSSGNWRWPNAAKARGGPVTKAEMLAGRRFITSENLTSDIASAQSYGLAGDPGRIRGYASGGRVSGPGGIDNLLLAATSGEYMINSRSARAYAPLLDRINSSTVRGGIGYGAINVFVSNYGVLGSQADVDAWMVKSMERLRRTNRLPSAN